MGHRGESCCIDDDFVYDGQEVPSSGMIEKWLPLEKPEGAKSKRQRRGDVNVSLLLSTEKDQNLTSQEHKHLLKILFAYELQRSQVCPRACVGERACIKRKVKQKTVRT